MDSRHLERIPPFGKTAQTRSWEKAEDKRKQLEEAAEEQAASIRASEAPPRASELVTVQNAVKKFLASKRTENLADSTLDKLTTIFEKAQVKASNLDSLLVGVPYDLRFLRDPNYAEFPYFVIRMTRTG